MWRFVVEVTRPFIRLGFYFFNLKSSLLLNNIFEFYIVLFTILLKYII